MKQLLIPTLFLICLTSYGQKTKTEKISSHMMGQEKINVMYEYGSNDELLGIKIHAMARDSRYKELIEYITVYYGSPQDFYHFLTSLEEFRDNEKPGTSITIGRHSVRYDKFFGTKYLNVYEEDGNGYHSFMASSIDNIKEKFVKWADENSIDLTQKPVSFSTSNSSLIAKDETDEFNGLRTISTRFENKIGISEYGYELNSFITKVEKENLSFYAINFSLPGLDQCLSEYDGKAMIKLSNDEIIEMYQVSDTDCSESPYAIYYPIKRNQSKVSELELSNTIKRNVELLRQNEWKIIRVYTGKGYIDYFPNEDMFATRFFQDHLSALK